MHSLTNVLVNWLFGDPVIQENAIKSEEAARYEELIALIKELSATENKSDFKKETSLLRGWQESEFLQWIAKFETLTQEKCQLEEMANEKENEIKTHLSKLVGTIQQELRHTVQTKRRNSSTS